MRLLVENMGSKASKPALTEGNADKALPLREAIRDVPRTISPGSLTKEARRGSFSVDNMLFITDDGKHTRIAHLTTGKFAQFDDEDGGESIAVDLQRKTKQEG